MARQLYLEWFPQIVDNHHQSGPFPSRIWGPPMKDPVNPNLDPLVVSTINQIGEAMRKRFDEEEKPGYSSHMLYDIWWNGSMRGGPDYHNMAGFLTETSLYRMATPHCYAAGRDSRDVRRAAQESAGEDSERQLHQSVARRLLAVPQARRVHAHGVARRARSAVAS